jgi:hypothetical protein
MKRPAGVTMLAIVLFVLGAFSLLWSAALFGVGGLSSLFGGLIGADQVAAFGTSTAWSGFLTLITGVVQIVVGFGLLGVKSWAWWLALVGVGLNILQGVFGIFSGGTWGVICGSIGLIIPILVLIYLLTPGIRKVFSV